MKKLLAEFKWYRKRKGGTWYYVELTDSGGMASPISYWTQKKPDNGVEVLAEEKY